MVFEKKQLSKALAIALMVACAVAFMPLLNGQAFAAAKKPAKVKSLKAAQVADTMTAKATWKKGKNCKKYNVKVDGVLVAKKQKAKSYTTEALTEGAHKIAVAGVNGKKVGKYKTVTVNIVAPTPPTPKLEVTGVVQSGVKQLKVTLSQPVGDVAGYKFTVTRDGKAIDAVAKIDPNDPNSVLLDLDTTIVKGVKYDVAVASAEGLLIPTAPGASTEVAGQDEVVAAIAIDENLVLDSDTPTASGSDPTPYYSGKITYAVKNQFGEDVTKKYYDKVSVSSTIGTAGTPAADGTVAVTKILQIQGIPGTEGTVVAVYTETGVNATQTVKVGSAAKISAVDIMGVYETKALNAGTLKETTVVAKDYKDNAASIVFGLKDQYGREYAETLAAGDLNLNVVGGLTNVTGGAVAKITIGDDTYYAVPLLAESGKEVAAGEVSVVAVATKTGAKGDYKFTVSDQNVIADLTVTAPDQVIAGDKNIFTVDAKNSAGDAITDYDSLKAGIKLPGTNGATANGTFKWKKLADGTGQLYLDATAVQIAEDVTITSAVFQAVDTYKTSVVQFPVLAGYGVPVAVTDFAVTSNNNGQPVLFDNMKFVDKFDNEIYYKLNTTTNTYDQKSDTALSALAYNKISALRVELTNDANGKLTLVPTSPATVTNKVGIVGVNNSLGGTALYQALAKFTVTSTWDNPDITSLNGKLNVGLMDKPTSGDSKLIVNSDVSKAFSVSKGVKKYDSYIVEVWSGNVYDGETDVTEIFKGHKKGDTFDAYPTATTYTVHVFGQIAGSDTKYALTSGTDYEVEGKYFNAAGSFTVPANYDGFYDYDSTTVKVYVTGETKSYDKEIKFSDAEPVATSIDALTEEYATVTATSTTINATQINNAVVAAGGIVRDQYGVASDQALTGVELLGVMDKNQDSVSDTKKYSFRGNANFTFTDIAINGDIPADYYLTLNMAWDGVTAEIPVHVEYVNLLTATVEDATGSTWVDGHVTLNPTGKGTVTYYKGDGEQGTSTKLTSVMDSNRLNPDRDHHDVFIAVAPDADYYLASETMVMQYNDQPVKVLKSYYKWDNNGAPGTWSIVTVNAQ